MTLRVTVRFLKFDVYAKSPKLRHIYENSDYAYFNICAVISAPLPKMTSNSGVARVVLKFQNRKSRTEFS